MNLLLAAGGITNESKETVANESRSSESHVKSPQARYAKRHAKNLRANTKPLLKICQGRKSCHQPIERMNGNVIQPCRQAREKRWVAALRGD